jgi:hypothetical protein
LITALVKKNTGPEIASRKRSFCFRGNDPVSRNPNAVLLVSRIPTPRTAVETALAVAGTFPHGSGIGILYLSY